MSFLLHDQTNALFAHKKSITIKHPKIVKETKRNNYSINIINLEKVLELVSFSGFVMETPAVSQCKVQVNIFISFLLIIKSLLFTHGGS